MEFDPAGRPGVPLDCDMYMKPDWVIVGEKQPQPKGIKAGHWHAKSFEERKEWLLNNGSDGDEYLAEDNNTFYLHKAFKLTEATSNRYLRFEAFCNHL